MSNDDSRDSKTPDRHAQPTINYRPILEALDTHTTNLLETVTTDDDLEPDTRRAATRHCRELRAELEYLRRHLPKTDAPEPLATITGPFEADWEAMRRRNARDADPRVDEQGGEADE
ncbi:hypothetical protein [Natronorubrum sulfidifaciens]|uniref:Uncharacterized protein n=1 Tax=Natronorubrum sulfidifaciens JCM 14089 TaxID=1230460 RepID=L9W8L9_9EURY|nr:hypothetical protein [Natronorubrum sulfidifaciens]ELY45596.1 hypothetical protein C495_08085 [Natronorubrum sulfidifaciens JCM 14089]